MNPDQRDGAAVLVLEDGRTMHGHSYRALGTTFGEPGLHAGMSGYQETLSDPSYHRQVVVMAAPHIGNTGERRGSRSRPYSGRRLRRARSFADLVELAGHPKTFRTSCASKDRGDPGGRHPGTDPAPSRSRRHARRRLQRSRRAAPPTPTCLPSCRPASAWRAADLASDVTTASPYRVPAIRRALHGGVRRPTSGRPVGGPPPDGSARDGRACRAGGLDRRADPVAVARRCLLLERTR